MPANVTPEISNAQKAPGGKAQLSSCARSLCLCDDALHTIDDGSHRRERLNLFIRIVRNLNPESILNIEYDYREIKRFDLKLAQGSFKRDGLRWVLMFLRKISMILVATSSISLSLPRSGVRVQRPSR